MMDIGDGRYRIASSYLLRQLAAQLPEDYKRAILRGIRKATKLTYELALDMSSGEMSLYDLASDDYPFARRHGYPLADPSIINVQTGEFLEAWEYSLPDMSSIDMAGHIWNDSPHADYLREGTEFVFARPIDKVLQMFLDEKTHLFVNEEVDKFLLQYG